MKKMTLLIAVLGTFFTAKAYRIEWGRDVVISQPVHEDLYVAGGTITINAPVYGDLIVAGGTVNLNDTITNDLLLAGGTVNIRGYVGDDIRCAGGNLFILNNIGGDLVITGGKIEIAKGVVINGGLITSGGNITVDGTINDDVKSASGNIVFNGIAKKDFESHSDKLLVNGTINGSSIIAANFINIGSNASFYNNVRYWSRQGNVDFRQSMKNGKVSFDRSLLIKGAHWYFLDSTSFWGFIWYLSTAFLFIIILQYLFSKTFKRAGNTVSRSIAKSLLWGFLFSIGVPMLVVLLLLTIIGIPFGLILMFSYIGILLLATIITSLVIANWYNIRFENNWSFWRISFAALTLFILFKLVSFTPFLGWLILVFIAFVAFGSILLNINWRRNHEIALQ